jgi:asparagine synthase (glutamine-hydrolysing)
MYDVTMCGIVLLLNTSSNSSSLKHRGPDDHNEVQACNHTMIFDRLSINDLSSNGRQPFCINDTWFMCNGEIYNHKMLKQVFDLVTTSNSDCEVIHRMILKFEMRDLLKCFRELDGDFAFVFVSSGHVIVARDPIGVRPLYVATADNGDIIGYASEAKAFPKASSVRHFPPGYYCHNGVLISYQPLTLHKPIVHEAIPRAVAMNKIRTMLYESVFKRILNSERPIAFFLSGGLDSSIIAAIASKISHPNKIHTYSVGTMDEPSPDLIAAQRVAEHIESFHHVVKFDPKDLFEKVPSTIRALESYDCTTVRASVPMYTLSEYISKNTDHKVILSGEGADELFGGYLYFHNAPDDTAFQDETIRLLQEVHMYDALRADRCTAAHGLELRVPFFDKAFVEYVISIDPSLKNPSTERNRSIEKLILREAFEDHLPHDIVHRQKNGMSDAVGYGWVDYVRDNATPIHPETDYLTNTPTSKEERYYREIYESMYGDLNLTPINNVWRPRWTSETDPSARKLVSLFKSDSEPLKG